MTEIFSTHNKNSKPKTCKFCHAEVWWHQLESRWYNPGGKEFHVCNLQQQHYKNEAYNRSEAKRGNK